MLQANATSTFSTSSAALTSDMNTYAGGPRLDTKFAYSGTISDQVRAFPGYRKCTPEEASLGNSGWHCWWLENAGSLWPTYDNFGLFFLRQKPWGLGQPTSGLYGFGTGWKGFGT